jgi:hypothetical protein
MPFIGLVIAMCFFFHHKRRWREAARWGAFGECGPSRDRDTKRERHDDRGARHAERRQERRGRRSVELSPEEEAARRARRRAAAETSFYRHAVV